MKATCIHYCSHAYDREKTIEFYEKALWMHITREKGPEDGSWINTFMANDASDFEIEITWNKVPDRVYENAGKDVHIAFRVEDFEAAKKLHQEMGVIVFENHEMGIYFIADPEGNWIEIIPEKK